MVKKITETRRLLGFIPFGHQYKLQLDDDIDDQAAKMRSFKHLVDQPTTSEQFIDQVVKSINRTAGMLREKAEEQASDQEETHGD